MLVTHSGETYSQCDRWRHSLDDIDMQRLPSTLEFAASTTNILVK